MVCLFSIVEDTLEQASCFLCKKPIAYERGRPNCVERKKESGLKVFNGRTVFKKCKTR